MAPRGLASFATYLYPILTLLILFSFISIELQFSAPICNSSLRWDISLSFASCHSGCSQTCFPLLKNVHPCITQNLDGPPPCVGPNSLPPYHFALCHPVLDDTSGITVHFVLINTFSYDEEHVAAAGRGLEGGLSTSFAIQKRGHYSINVLSGEYVHHLQE